MAAFKNHHFVPQFYFRLFSKDGNSINVLHRATGNIYKTASIRKQASKPLFYGTVEIEDSFKAIEQECSEAIKNLARCASPLDLTRQDVERIQVWIAFQRSRTMSARQAIKPMNDRMLQLFMEMKLGNDGSVSDDLRPEFLNIIRNLESDPVRSHLVAVKTALEISGALNDLSPILLRNKTPRPFLFSDAPAVFYNALYRQIVLRGVLGFDTPGLMIFFPVSDNVLLLLLDASVYGVKGPRRNVVTVRDLRDIVAINKLQVHSAEECVYFGDPAYGIYVHDLWHTERNALRDHLGKVVEAPGFSQETGESIGDIVHSFEPQLPYRLRLSFLSYTEVPEAHYRFDQRSKRKG